MLDFLNKFFRREESSRTQAKERLRLVLMSDRVSLAPDVFDSMKGEMLTVVRRYLDIDERNLDVHFENAERQFMLLANIPVLKVRPVVVAVGAIGNGSSQAASQSGDMALELMRPEHAAATRPRRRRRRRKQRAPDPGHLSDTPPDAQ